MNWQQESCDTCGYRDRYRHCRKNSWGEIEEQYTQEMGWGQKSYFGYVAEYENACPDYMYDGRSTTKGKTE